MSYPQNYEPQPAPTISPSEERTWAMVAHGAPLAAMALSGGLLGFVGSLVVYVIYRDRGPFVRAHSANSLNIQITAVIMLVVSIPLMLILVGFITFIAAFVYGFVMNLIGLIKANRGEWWDPPMTFRFIR